MLNVRVEAGDRMVFDTAGVDGAFTVRFHRTLRIPDDGINYPLPPGLGSFPVRRVLAYRDRVPADWVKTSGVFLPLYQREALWVSFEASGRGGWGGRRGGLPAGSAVGVV